MKLTRRDFVNGLSFTLLLTPIAGTVLSQERYPSKPVTVVVPYNAGGPVDMLGRAILEKVEERLGQRFIIDAKPGAGGAVGADYVVRQPKDGYTLLLGSAPALVTSKVLNANTIKFDPLVDLTPVKTISRRPYVLFIKDDSEFSNLEEFLTAVRNNPGKFNFSSSGTGGSDHFTTEYFLRLAGLDMVHVPYNGGAAAIQAVESGEVDMYFGGLTQYAQYAHLGRLKGIGVSSLERISQLPHLPIIADLVPDFKAYASIDMFAPAGTPQEIISLLASEVTRAMTQPGVKERVLESGELSDAASEEILTLMKEEYQTISELAKALDLQAQ